MDRLGPGHAGKGKCLWLGGFFRRPPDGPSTFYAGNFFAFSLIFRRRLPGGQRRAASAAADPRSVHHFSCHTSKYAPEKAPFRESQFFETPRFRISRWYPKCRYKEFSPFSIFFSSFFWKIKNVKMTAGLEEGIFSAPAAQACPCGSAARLRPTVDKVFLTVGRPLGNL